MQTIKCVLVGDVAADKTRMLISYVSGKTEYYVPVFDNYYVTGLVDGEPYTLELFDTAGLEDYDRLRPLQYPQTDIFLVCFSVVSPYSYENVTAKWVPEITHHCPGVPFLLVGTKVDLRDDPEVVERLAENRLKPISRDMGEKLAREVKAVKYVECSVRSQWQVKDVFEKAICAALELAPARSKNRKCLLL